MKIKLKGAGSFGSEKGGEVGVFLRKGKEIGWIIGGKKERAERELSVLFFFCLSKIRKEGEGSEFVFVKKRE